MSTSFIERLRARARLIGTLVTLPTPEIAEALARCGYDWLWIDLEHSALSLRDCQQILAATQPRAAGLVRVPSLDPTWIKQVLDLGADGVIVPQVVTAQEAAGAVRAAKYPPMGERGAGLARAQAFGTGFKSYVGNANQHTAVLLQIEHARAVEQIDAILAVEGVDGIIVGPYDLSGSLNLLGQTEHPDVLAAIERVKSAARRANRPVGIFTFGAADARRLLESGFDLVALGTDAHFLLQAAREALAAVQHG